MAGRMNMNGLAPSIAKFGMEHDFHSAKSSKSFDDFDARSPDLRQCVHEFGLPIVTSCLNRGVVKPSEIRQLVNEIWSGARHCTQRRKQSHIGKLDWILIQSGAVINAATLLRVLSDHSLVVVNKEPSKAMVEASMDAVNHMGVVSKFTKHKNRLRAAIKAGKLNGDD